MSSDLVPIRVIVVNLTVVLALIFATSSLLTKYYLKPPNLPSTQGARRLSQTLSNNNDHYIWSTELADWALDDLQLSDDELLSSPSQQMVDTCLWPNQRAEICPLGDRIINQLLLNDDEPAERKKLFKISVANDYSLPEGRELFAEHKCKVNNCLITHDLGQADAIIFPNAEVRTGIPNAKRSEQIWIAHLLESPPNTFDRRFPRTYRGRHTFNWTASYRSDSDIVTPYSKFVPYLSSAKSFRSVKSGELGLKELNEFYEQASQTHRDLIKSKRTKVAWFVSNCHAKNNRLELAQELAKYIKVDIFGKCGNLTCSRLTQDECLSRINRDYKFYLAFENSNNREYITEKLYRNSLGYNNPDHLLLPIVMGPPLQDYVRLAPPNSFIHINEFDSIEDLAKFLLHLGENNALYYSYFLWKSYGMFVDTKFMCRVCAMLYESDKSKRVRIISNLQDWWLNESTL